MNSSKVSQDSDIPTKIIEYNNISFYWCIASRFRYLLENAIFQKQLSDVFKNGALWHFSKFKGKHLRRSLFFNKVTGLVCNFILKVRFVHKYLLLSFKECHKILFLQNNSVRLLLIFSSILEATYLTLSWRRPLSYRNQSMDWFLYHNGLRHEKVNYNI